MLIRALNSPHGIRNRYSISKLSDYLADDIKGNWIKRVSRTYTSYPGSGYPSDKSIEIETRQIIYYE